MTRLLLVVVAVAALVASTGMAAGAFPADWAYSNSITIEEHSGSDLTDSQIPVGSRTSQALCDLQPRSGCALRCWHRY